MIEGKRYEKVEYAKSSKPKEYLTGQELRRINRKKSRKK